MYNTVTQDSRLCAVMSLRATTSLGGDSPGGVNAIMVMAE